MKLLILIFMLTLSFNSSAYSPPLICKNDAPAYVYTGFKIKESNSFIAPSGHYAVIDVILQPIHEDFLLSGKVMNSNGEVIKAPNGSSRWFLVLEDWNCKYFTGDELEVSY